MSCTFCFDIGLSIAIILSFVDICIGCLMPYTHTRSLHLYHYLGQIDSISSSTIRNTQLLGIVLQHVFEYD